MDTIGKLANVSRDWQTGKLQITFEVDESAVGQIDDIKDVEKLSIKAVKHKEKRSIEANAYCWTLLHKIAAKTSRKAEDIYRDYIRDFGVCEIIPIKEEAIARWRKTWESKGYGWITEDMGECRTVKGYRNIKCFYGSSSYTTLEMSRFIDAIVQDCKELGIDTATPAEIERMIEIWGNR